MIQKQYPAEICKVLTAAFNFSGQSLIFVPCCQRQEVVRLISTVDDTKGIRMSLCGDRLQSLSFRVIMVIPDIVIPLVIKVPPHVGICWFWWSMWRWHLIKYQAQGCVITSARFILKRLRETFD